MSLQDRMFFWEPSHFWFQLEVMFRMSLLLLVVTFLLALVRACPLCLYLRFAAGVVFSFCNEPSQFVQAASASTGGNEGLCSQSKKGEDGRGRQYNTILLAFWKLPYSPPVLVTLSNSVFSADFAVLMRMRLSFSNSQSIFNPSQSFLSLWILAFLNSFWQSTSKKLLRKLLFFIMNSLFHPP